MTEPTWPRQFTEAAISARAGPRTYARGQGYAGNGRVRELTYTPEGHLRAAVTGSRHTAYRVLVRPNGVGPRTTFDGTCTCPVGYNCKHVVAALLAARNGAAPSQADWQRRLDPIVQAAPASGSGAGPATPLGLHVRVDPRDTRYGAAPGRRISVRPMAIGRSGKWVKTGAGWEHLAYGYLAGASPEQVNVLQRLWRVATSGRAAYLQYSRTEWLDLAPIPAGLWATLQGAAEAALPVVLAADPERSVTVLPEPVTTALDLSADPSGAGLRLGPLVQAGDERWPSDQLVWLGDPPHGVVRVTPSGDGTAEPLTFARLDRPLGREVGQLVRAGGDLAIPRDDVPRFLGGYYPRLRRHVEVGSADGSVALPELAAPRLVLDVEFERGHVALLRWSFGYAVGTPPTLTRVSLHAGAAPTHVDAPPLDIDDTGAGRPSAPAGWIGVLRDETAEHALLDGLTVLDALPGASRVPSGARRLPEGQRLAGHDTREFVELVLPGLQADSRVVVTVTGEPAAYRLEQQAPVIEVSTTQAAPEGDGGGNDWFDLGVSVTVGGEPVPFQTLFTALAAGEDHLYLDSGTWFSLDRPEYAALRRLIAEARALQDRPTGPLRLTPYQAGLWEELVELGVVAEQSRRWTEVTTALLDWPGQPRPELPAGLTATLRPYQLDGFHWLSTLWDLGLGGILADDMGLGKTVQVLALAERARERGELDAPLLIVAPTSVLDTWAAEARRFTPGLPVVLVGETSNRRGTTLAAAVAGAGLVVTSYAVFRIDAEAFQGVTWRGLVLDEAQFVKNHRAKAYQCARRLPAPFRLAVTGTPLENSLMDLWALLSIVAPGVFPSPEKFTEIYRRPIESGGSPEALASLRRRVRPLMLRRTKALVAAELPPKQEAVVRVDLAPSHRRVYDRHLQRERARVLGMLGEDFQANRIAILRSLTTLRLLSLHPGLADPAYSTNVASAKVDALVEQLAEIAAEGHRALVFSQFTGYLALIRERLEHEGIGYAYLDGRTRHRPERIAAWRAGPEPVFLISLKAGGFGLTLTEADYVFVMDPWWNPATETQAVDRTHRIGQDKTVMVYRLVSKDTIEERVVALQERKRALFTTVIDEGALASGALTAEDIRGLLQE
ncbi:MAG: DEAD/DEAH box helicase [Dermatophilaceae bacterium]